MTKICKVTGKKRNNAYSISHSHIRTKKIQNINLQNKKIWSCSLQRWIKQRVSTKAIKSLAKKS
uniref:Large ribosomal subunit protein bL28c n=1 Tax=Kumanoa americana TaxID=1196377 RepID=A0A1C9CGK5_9FLOR|nr:ribosomal protein L28 [Kumanoa americana]AOM67497.1 ribosomal protein L28 [Kumanoa americana]